MKKTINVKEPTELVLEFTDGNSLSVVFDAKAISNFNALEGGITDFINEDSFPERCAKIIYIGALERHGDLTLEEVRSLVSQMDLTSIMEIVNEFNESMGASKNGVLNDIQKKLMKQFLDNKRMK